MAETNIMKEFRQKLLESDATEPSMFINDITRLFWKNVLKDSQHGNLSQGYRRIFHILCVHDGLTQVELAKLSQLSSPSVSAALYKMEEDGLVKRVPDSKDRRKVYVYITEKGRAEDEAIREHCRQTDEILLRGITPEEKKYVTAVLKRMLQNMLEEVDD